MISPNLLLFNKICVMSILYLTTVVNSTIYWAKATSTVITALSGIWSLSNLNKIGEGNGYQLHKFFSNIERAIVLFPAVTVFTLPSFKSFVLATLYHLDDDI